MSALQQKIGSSSDQYIEVTHAVPTKFSMEKIPNSPATTPSQGSTTAPDYFSMNTVFAKAATVVDHHTAMLSSVPSSPHPVVAPSSVNISMLERYIPPSDLQEYEDLFSIEGPSNLIDRLTEITPKSGNLLFVYPTSVGARTFTRAYLGQILAPLLRTMTGIHNLSADLAQEINHMAAVDHMVSYDRMLQKIRRLLTALNQSQKTSKTHYSLAFSRKDVIEVGCKAWTEWWVGQEAPRVRQAVNRYFVRGSRPPASNVTSGSLAREILDGVLQRGRAGESQKMEGIEVGVFVIRRGA